MRPGEEPGRFFVPRLKLRMRVRLLVSILLFTACASVAPAPPLRVLVYNMHAGKDAAGVESVARIAEVVTAAKADVVLLQEVDRGTTRSGGVDQVAMLTRLTGLHGAFGKSLDYQGGEYGIAILSRWPIVAQQVVPLIVNPPQERAGGSHEPRVALIVETRTPAGPLEIINTHIDASREDVYRVQEAGDLVQSIAGRSAAVRLVGGDFNSTPDSRVHETMTRAGFRDAFAKCGSGDGKTYPDGVPAKRIDYLWLSGSLRCSSARVIDTRASDHRPVLVEVVR